MKHTTIAIALLTLVASFASACGGEETAADDGRVQIEVNASGYEPAQVQATAGQPLTLVFTRTTDEGCGQELVIPAHDVRRRLPLDEPVEVTITPTEAGELRFTCGMDMYDGAIVVR